MTAAFRAGRGDVLPRPAPAPGVPLGVNGSELMFLPIGLGRDYQTVSLFSPRQASKSLLALGCVDAFQIRRPVQ